MHTPSVLASITLVGCSLLGGCGGEPNTSTGPGSGGSSATTSEKGGGGAGGDATTSGGAGATGGGGAATTTGSGGASIVDKDGDGLDDAMEDDLAKSYLPFLSLDPGDGCPLGGMLL